MKNPEEKNVSVTNVTCCSLDFRTRVNEYLFSCLVVGVDMDHKYLLPSTKYLSSLSVI